MKKNREILIAIQALINEFDMKESDHEAVILSGMTSAENPTPEAPFQTMVAGGGKMGDISDMFLNLMKYTPTALPAVEQALLRLAMERKVDFVLPLIAAVFTPIRQPNKPASNIIQVPNRIIKPGQQN